MQLVLMSLKPSEEIGKELHKHTTQFIRVESGNCKVIVGNKHFNLRDDGFVIIPPNKMHNVINTSKTKKSSIIHYLFPPEHNAKCIQRSKLDKCKSDTKSKSKSKSKSDTKSKSKNKSKSKANSKSKSKANSKSKSKSKSKSTNKSKSK
jgi:oxalate decarboxylase/phosphoglucose isomerase-like protein (cupin superfamily)